MANAQQTLKDYADEIDSGHFDWGTKAKISMAGWTALSGWLAYESAKLYLTLGAQGTALLPPTSFFQDKETLGKYSAFLCNFSLNWYFVLKTTLDIRNVYLDYQARKNIGKPMSPSEITGKAIKIFIGLGMAATTGTIFALIAKKDSNLPLYNQAITGGVNVILNLQGSMTLENYIISAVKWLAACCIKSCVSSPTSDAISSNVNENYKALAREKNDTFNPSQTAKQLASSLSDSNSNSALLAIGSVNRTSMKAKATKLGLYGLVWSGLQYCNVVSLLGYYSDTVVNVGLLLKMIDTPEAGLKEIPDMPIHIWILGTLFFSTFLGLALKLVGETIDDTIELGQSAVEERKYVEGKTIAIMSGAALLIGAGYFFAYVSSNSSLALNSDYGFEQAWNIMPTCVGTTLFNGFVFFQIFLELATTTKKYVVYNKEKRTQLNHASRMNSFVKSNPGLFDDNRSDETKFHTGEVGVKSEQRGDRYHSVV